MKKKRQQEEILPDSAQPNLQVDPSVETSPNEVDPDYEKKKERKRLKLKLLKIGMCVVLTCAVIAGLLFLILPLFHVSEIVVEGNDRYYTAEEIIAASGIHEGEENFAVISARSNGVIQKKLFSGCPALKTVQISCGFSKVTIKVTEMKNMMYTAVGTSWYAVNGDLRMIEKSGTESRFSNFMKVKLPKVSGVTIGYPIAFANNSINYDYITDLLAVLEEYDVLDKVTYIDFSNKLYLSCVFGDRIRLNLGSLSDIEHKLDEFAKILRQKGGDEYAVIDVSITGQESYRIIFEDELYD